MHRPTPHAANPVNRAKPGHFHRVRHNLHGIRNRVIKSRAARVRLTSSPLISAPPTVPP